MLNLILNLSLFDLDWSPEKKQHLAEELSDVLLYLLRLADRCHVGKDKPKK
jgi:phenylpyruvate tautomerase PptA (4-oxalocrotonate tautomerase family)